MKLLFDQNLSPRLVALLSDLFPQSAHVFPLGLGKVLDAEVWDYAREKGFVVVSKDADFSEMSLLKGYPPKLIWLRMGNCTTSQIEKILRAHHKTIGHMVEDETVGTLSLF